MDWMQLKSGSDVRGVAVGDQAVLTPHVAQCLGMAFARFVAARENKPITQVTIAIGRDSRISGPALQQAAAEGISKALATNKDNALPGFGKLMIVGKNELTEEKHYGSKEKEQS